MQFFVRVILVVHCIVKLKTPPQVYRNLKSVVLLLLEKVVQRISSQGYILGFLVTSTGFIIILMVH